GAFGFAACRRRAGLPRLREAQHLLPRARANPRTRRARPNPHPLAPQAACGAVGGGGVRGDSDYSSMLRDLSPLTLPPSATPSTNRKALPSQLNALSHHVTLEENMPIKITAAIRTSKIKENINAAAWT